MKDTRKLSRGGAGYRPGRFTRRWRRLWLRWNGPGPLGRIASRLAALGCPPHFGRVPLAHITPRGYIDAAATIYHSDLRLGQKVYLAHKVLVYENDKGGCIQLGDRVAVYQDVVLETGQRGYIEVGAQTSIHPGCQLKAYLEPITVGEGVMIAANVAIYSYDHGMAPDTPIRGQALTSKGPVSIHRDAWIGTGAIILSGVTIGEGAVVAAGAVITKDVPRSAIVAGNPGRVIKTRFELSNAGEG